MSFLKEFPQIKELIILSKRKKINIYLVGGFLRDAYLGRPCVDFDFTVERNALKVGRSFARRIKGAFVLLDEERGCARVVKKQKRMIYTFDLADFRAATLRGDLSHRDFTINTLSADLKDLKDDVEVLDVVTDLKKGISDLERKTIRMVSTKVFKEDPLRLLRAYSLRAALGFTIESKTLAQIKKDRRLIRKVSYERIREELFKIMAAEKTAENLKAMDKIGLLEEAVPQISIMYNVKQGAYHHLDVWTHSLETVFQLEKIFADLEGQPDVLSYLNEELGGGHQRRDIIKMAALLHDIGKPDARRKEQKRTIFHGHERLGKGIVRHIAKMMKLSTRERYALEDMVFWHLRPGYLSNFKKPSDRAVFRFFRDAKEEGVSILLLSLADQRATRGPLTTEKDQKHHEKICLGLVKKHFEKKKEKPFERLINGNDLIKTLKLTPSAVFSKILADVEEKQATGKIKTKKEALDLARRIMKKK